MRTVDITAEPVELFKILKFESLVSSGGEAKTAIADGLVEVNGEVETRKRKKIMSGDVIKFSGEVLLIRHAPVKRGTVKPAPVKPGAVKPGAVKPAAVKSDPLKNVPKRN